MSLVLYVVTESSSLYSILFMENQHRLVVPDVGGWNDHFDGRMITATPRTNTHNPERPTNRQEENTVF